MKMKKRFLGILLSLVMVLGLMPGMSLTAYAEDSYALWVGGTQVTSANAHDIPATNGTKSGTASYNAETHTLTLNNYNYVGTGYHYGSNSGKEAYSAVYWNDSNELTIQLKESNSVISTLSGNDVICYWVYANKGAMRIQGSGSLHSKCGDVYDSYALRIRSGSLNISNVTLKLESGASQGKSYGLYTSGGCIIGENANVTAAGGNAGSFSYGISAVKGLTINGGLISATGGEAGNRSAGIRANNEGSFTIKEGEIFAQGKNYGIYNEINLDINKVAQLIAIGNTSAFSSTVKNAMTGSGWTNPEGTQGKATIAISNEGQDLSSYKKVQFPTVPVTGLTVKPAKDTMLIGDELVLQLIYTPEDATDKDYTIGGYDSNVVNVDENGVVTAKAVGTTTITVTATNGTDDKSDDCTAICEITVNKLDNKVTKAPEAKTLTYNGQAQELVTAGTAKGGTLQYALGTDDKTAPTSGYTTSIPTGTNAGTYYIWYKVVGDKKYNDIAPKPISVTISQTESEKHDATLSGGDGGGSLPQAQDPAPTTTPSETVEQPTTTGDPTITQDAFTGVSETIAPSTDGTASVTSVSGTVGKTLRITGTVNQGGTNYPVSSFATNAFSNVDAKNIFIDLKTSGNTQTVTFQPRTFKGSEAKKLTLRLSSSGQVKFSSGAMSGSKIKKVVVSGLKKKEFKRVEKKLRKSGYKGKIVKK